MYDYSDGGRMLFLAVAKQYCVWVVVLSSTGSNSKESTISQCKYLEALFSKIRFPVHQFSPSETTNIVRCCRYQVQRQEISFELCFKSW